MLTKRKRFINFAFFKDNALAVTAGNTDITILCFAGAVYNAAHYGNLKGLIDYSDTRKY